MTESNARFYELRRVELTRRIAENEAELRRALVELRETANRIMSLREQMRRRPVLWIGAAFMIGLMFGKRRTHDGRQRIQREW